LSDERIEPLHQADAEQQEGEEERIADTDCGELLLTEATHDGSIDRAEQNHTEMGSSYRRSQQDQLAKLGREVIPGSTQGARR